MNGPCPSPSPLPADWTHHTANPDTCRCAKPDVSVGRGIFVRNTVKRDNVLLVHVQLNIHTLVYNHLVSTSWLSNMTCCVRRPMMIRQGRSF